MRYSLVELAPLAPGGNRPTAVEQALLAATEAERAGYHRIWFGEHPGAAGYASLDPAVLIAAAAERVSRIRLGSGAVLLNHYSPFSVAERFMMLEALAPGRIDLGVGRSGGGPLVDAALRRVREIPLPNDFDEQVREIIAHFHNAFDQGHPFASINLTAGAVSTPDVWVLGSSGNSAALAGRLGIGYSFGGQINPAMIHTALRIYRDSFTPTPFGSGEPQVILGLNIVAADDAEQAHRLTWPARALRVRGEDRPIPTVEQAQAELSNAEKNRTSAIMNGLVPPQISGTPESLRQQLEPLIHETGADEIIILDMLTDFELRQRSRELIAEVLAGIEPKLQA